MPIMYQLLYNCIITLIRLNYIIGLPNYRRGWGEKGNLPDINCGSWRGAVHTDFAPGASFLCRRHCFPLQRQHLRWPQVHQPHPDPFRSTRSKVMGRPFTTWYLTSEVNQSTGLQVSREGRWVMASVWENSLQKTTVSVEEAAPPLQVLVYRDPILGNGQTAF